MQNQSTRDGRNSSHIPKLMRNHSLSSGVSGAGSIGSSSRDEQNQKHRQRNSTGMGTGTRTEPDTSLLTPPANRRMSTPSPSLIPTHAISVRKSSTPKSNKEKLEKKGGTMTNNADGPHRRPRPQSQPVSSVRSLAAKFEGGSKNDARTMSAALPQREGKEMEEEEDKEELQGIDQLPSEQQDEGKENEQIGDIQTPQKKSRRPHSTSLSEMEEIVEDVNSTPRATLSNSDKSSPKSTQRWSNLNSLKSLSFVGGIETDDDDNESVPSRIPSLSLTERSLPTRMSMASLVEHPDMPSPTSETKRSPTISTQRSSSNSTQKSPSKSTQAPTIPPPRRVVEPNGVALSIGIPCIVACKPKRRGKSSSFVRFRALVRYLGTLANELGPWVGVEIPSEEITQEKLNSVSGWNDGILQDRRYFDVCFCLYS